MLSPQLGGQYGPVFQIKSVALGRDIFCMWSYVTFLLNRLRAEVVVAARPLT